MTLTLVSAPEGGKWFAYTENLGAIDRMYASSETASDVPLPPGTHMHTAWAFTKPGTYTIDVTARAKQSSGGEQGARSAGSNHDGGEATAETQRLTFVVEKKSATEEPGDTEPPVEEPSEEPTEEPTPEDPTERPTEDPAEPTEQPSDSPTGQPTDEAAPEHPTDAPADPTQPDGTDNAGGTDNASTPSDAGGALARTGAEIVPTAALAAVTVVAGMGLLMVTRRRRA